MLTLGNLACGVASIIYSADAISIAATGAAPMAKLFTAALLLFIAMVFDALDGKVARMTGTASQFGAELDSLADLVTFGCAPAILVWRATAHMASGDVMVDSDAGRKVLFGICILYAACTALRLARFNVDTDTSEDSHRWFRGLPSPAAAAFVATTFFLYEYLLEAFRDAPETIETINSIFTILLPAACGVGAALMVSNMPYVHVVTQFFGGRRPMVHLLRILGLIFVVFIWTQPAIAAAVYIYVLSGPIIWALRWRRGQLTEGEEDVF
jgi:CDP-diacylglycerol--serine O-phosphatidyltransferase